jgi:anti-sigma factor (TIGR02949 family)
VTHRRTHDEGACREIFERLSEYMDEELPPDLCERIEAHMGDCPPCVAFLESLRRTVRLVESIDAPTLPDELREAVRSAYGRYREETGGM